jgi:hypothetical protein
MTGSADTRREAEPGRQDGPAEYQQSRLDRQVFDAAAWSAALAARREMPAWRRGLVTEQTARRIREGLTEPVLITASGPPGRVRKAEAAVTPAIELQVVDVEPGAGEAGDVDGTLVVPVMAEALAEVDPRSLSLHRWNERAGQYDLLPESGFDVSGGYVHGRITAPGRYAVLGVPTEKALTEVQRGAGRPVLQRLLYWLILRIFDPSGPWSSLGPVNLSCCIMDLAVDPAQPGQLYAAASDGGVWRLDSILDYPGRTWKPVTDGQPSLQVQCLAVSPADPAVVYYVDSGGLLHRSADRGEHWTTPSPASIGYAQRLIAHPGDPNTFYVATSSGLRCSADGGTSWLHNPGMSSLLDGDILDAAIDPDTPAILYAAQRSIGLKKSYDAGGSWTTVLPWSRAAAPAATAIRVAVGRQGTDATRTVAVRFDQEVLINRRGGRDIGVPAGGPWTSAGQVGGTGYGDWCHVIAVDPFDDNLILSGAQQLYRTPDGGLTWALVIDYYRPHEDQHRIVFDPIQPGVVYAANDGGVFRSTDRGVTWQADANDVANRIDLTHGLVTAQFYTAAMSGDHAMGNLYHQGIVAADSLRAGSWEGVEGHAWEFNNIYGDPVRHNTYYVFGGQLFRRDFPGGALTAISTFTPTAIAVTGSGRLLAAGRDGLIRSTTDPTTASPAWTTMAGFSSMTDSVVAIAIAPSQPERAYAVTAAGRVFACADASVPTAWTAVTATPAAMVVALAVATEDPSVLFAATETMVYRSLDGGGSWTAANGTGTTALPPGASLRSVVTGPGALYTGAAVGVFTSPDRGDHWYDFSAGLPNVELKELMWTQDDLFAVTHGRGVWHRGRYEVWPLPGLGPQQHVPDPAWLIELWLAIHGGDPAPDVVRSMVRTVPQPFRQGNAPR